MNTAHEQRPDHRGQLRASRRILQVGALACVLASLPSPLFDLDRHQMPKELVLHAVAGLAALLALRGVRRLPVTLVDLLLVAYLALSAAAAIGATNHWLSFRAFAVTLSGALVFWTARAIARAGLGRPLLVAFAGAAVIGAMTGLLQAYGAELPLTAATRAPGGTFGNRNFMAHLVAVTMPALLLITLETQSRTRAVLGSIGTALAGGALLLSRSRAAWLGVVVPAVFFIVEGFRTGGFWSERRFRGRFVLVAGFAAAGVAAALLLPNRLDWRSDSPYLESLVGVANFREGSGHGRLVQYRNTFSMMHMHPVLGVGPGNWPVAYPLYTTPGDPAFDAGDIMPTNPWPSSDWIAIAAERGMGALLMLLAAGAVMAFTGLKRTRRDPKSADAVSGLALTATVLATVVAGSFDAVLLLAVPSLFVWGLLGALLPVQRELADISLGDARRRAVAIFVGAAATIFMLRSAAQCAAMLLARDGRGVRAVTWAARLDPGSYRLRMLLAGTPTARGPCDRVRVHAAAAHELFPHHDAPARLLRACGVRVSVR